METKSQRRLTLVERTELALRWDNGQIDRIEIRDLIGQLRLGGWARNEHPLWGATGIPTYNAYQHDDGSPYQPIRGVNTLDGADEEYDDDGPVEFDEESEEDELAPGAIGGDKTAAPAEL